MTLGSMGHIRTGAESQCPIGTWGGNFGLKVRAPESGSSNTPNPVVPVLACSSPPCSPILSTVTSNFYRTDCPVLHWAQVRGRCCPRTGLHCREASPPSAHDLETVFPYLGPVSCEQAEGESMG